MKTLKLISFIVLSFFISFPVVAKEKKYKNGDFYSGEWKKGKPNGQGKMTFANGVVYEGLWIDGKIVGEGTIFIPSIECTFTGTFIPVYYGDKFVWFEPIKGTEEYGKDRYIEKYIGEWKGENFVGTLYTPTFTYTGEIQDSQKVNGRLDFKGSGYMEGKMIGTDQFEGTIDANLDKSYLLNSKAHYKGKFVGGKFIGNVTGNNPTSEIVTFNMDIDETGNPKGTLSLKNGSKYQGEIKNFKRDGIGTLTKKGVSIEGIWINDKISSGSATEKIYDSYGLLTNTYKFTIKNNEATFIFSDGEVMQILNVPLDGSSLYSQVEKRQKEKDELARKELERQREEERKLARAKDAKEIDQKYAGMVFQGEGSLDMISGVGELALMGFLFGSQMTQTITVTFLPGGKVRVRETASNVSHDTTSQAMAMARNQQGGHVFEATIDGNKIDIGPFYLIVAPDKKSLGIYGPDGDGYKLKRK